MAYKYIKRGWELGCWNCGQLSTKPNQKPILYTYLDELLDMMKGACILLYSMKKVVIIESMALYVCCYEVKFYYFTFQVRLHVLKCAKLAKNQA